MSSLSSEVRSIVSIFTIAWVERFGRKVEGSELEAGVRLGVAVEVSGNSKLINISIDLIEGARTYY